MQLLPTYAEQLHSPLPPADLLRRLDGPYPSSYAGGLVQTTSSYRPIHEFEGVLTATYFTIRRLPLQHRTGRTVAVALRPQACLEGWPVADGSGSTLLHLRYQPAPAWSLLLIMASALAKFITQGDPLLLALLQATGIDLVAWLLAWGFFRYEVNQWRRELAELLLLRAVVRA